MSEVIYKQKYEAIMKDFEQLRKDFAKETAARSDAERLSPFGETESRWLAGFADAIRCVEMLVQESNRELGRDAMLTKGQVLNRLECEFELQKSAIFPKPKYKDRLPNDWPLKA